MRIGVHCPVTFSTDDALQEVLSAVRVAADAGLDTAWFRQLRTADTLIEIAVAGQQVPNISFGTAVIPSYPRHPLLLASQALTAQAACGNRLTLGLGTSHQRLIEIVYGYSFDRPARHMREYLTALMSALRGEQVNFHGETLTAQSYTRVIVPGGEVPSVLLAAFGPSMLRLAGELTDGTVTNMVGPGTLANHIVPAITAAAEAADRARRPRIVVGLPVLVTSDADAGRTLADETFGVYTGLPSYQKMLARENARGPGDISLVGDEESVTKDIARLADAGATDLAALLYGTEGDQIRTVALLSQLAHS